MPAFNANIWGNLRNNVNQDVWDVCAPGAPVDATTGVGLTGPGSTYTNVTTGDIYVNINTKASPTWSLWNTSTDGNFSSGTLLLPQGTTPAQTADGSIFWDTDDNLLSVGDGASRKTMVDLTSTQTLSGKTLTTPVIGVATGTSLAVTGLLKSSGASGGVGYATGAGGLGTQATNKSTTVVAVPNPSLCGAITMDAATLNAGVIVSFTLTNSGIAATDVLVLNHISGGTVGSYGLNAQCGAGSAVINVRNNTAGNLSEALVIQYVVIKGVNA